MSTDDPILRANTSWLPTMGLAIPATDLLAKYTTVDSVLEEAETFLRTSSPSVGNTISSDTDSESSETSELDGYEDLSEVMDLDYLTFLRWAALRNKAYRKACDDYAHTALAMRGSEDKKKPTIAELEWHAEIATYGLTKSYPFEAPLIELVLREKKNA